MRENSMVSKDNMQNNSSEINLLFTCTHWGQEILAVEDFLDTVISNNFNGVEINLPESGDFLDRFIRKIETIKLDHPDFVFIPQQLNNPENDTIDDYIKRVEKRLIHLISLGPTFINSHTGKDHFSFEDNCRVIEACMNISSKTGVRILHETHRGRFSFHAASLIPYLKKFPELELVGDFSHFCTVSESLLQDQAEIIREIIPYVSHIHARVGHEQSPQVNNPFAPEWENHLKQFVKWWQEIIHQKKEDGWGCMTITPEFGPAPYMPLAPFTQEPLGKQSEINIKLMHHLKSTLQT